jgi:hypothetical protein
LFTRNYEWLVKLAAKGLAERDNHPMPKSVTTPEAFYAVMARAALDAIGLAALLERVARAEQKLRYADEALKRERAMNGWAKAETENARLRAMIDEGHSEQSTVTTMTPGGR